MGGPIYFFSSYKMLNNIFYNNANYVHNAFCDSNYTQIADISTNKTVSAWGKTISHALFYSLFEYYMINRFQILNIQIVYLVLGLTYVLVAFSDDMQKGRAVFKVNWCTCHYCLLYCQYLYIHLYYVEEWNKVELNWIEYSNFEID